MLARVMNSLEELAPRVEQYQELFRMDGVELEIANLLSNSKTKTFTKINFPYIKKKKYTKYFVYLQNNNQQQITKINAKHEKDDYWSISSNSIFYSNGTECAAAKRRRQRKLMRRRITCLVVSAGIITSSAYAFNQYYKMRRPQNYTSMPSLSILFFNSIMI